MLTRLSSRATKQGKALALALLLASALGGGLFLFLASIIGPGSPTAALGRDSHCVRIELNRQGETPIDVPDFCIDDLCKLLIYQDTAIGGFGPGFFSPVYYSQSSDGSWIGGPAISIEGVDYSEGEGVNGDGRPEAIFGGGYTVDGGELRLYDDSDAESSAYRWTVVLHRYSVGPNVVRIFICPG